MTRERAVGEEVLVGAAESPARGTEVEDPVAHTYADSFPVTGVEDSVGKCLKPEGISLG